MPVTVHLAKAKIKDNNGNYRAIDAFSDQSGATLQQSLNNIELTKNEALKAITNPDYKTNGEEAGALQNAIKSLSTEIDTYISDIAKKGQEQLDKIKTAASNAQDIYNQYNTDITTTMIVDTENANMIAQPFDTTKYYPVNTYVRYAENEETKLYSLSKAHQPDESWQNTEKVETNIGEVLSHLNSTYDDHDDLVWITQSEASKNTLMNTESELKKEYRTRQYKIFKRKTTDADYLQLINTPCAKIFNYKVNLASLNKTGWSFTAETDNKIYYSIRLNFSLFSNITQTTIMNSNIIASSPLLNSRTLVTGDSVSYNIASNLLQKSLICIFQSQQASTGKWSHNLGLVIPDFITRNILLSENQTITEIQQNEDTQWWYHIGKVRPTIDTFRNYVIPYFSEVNVYCQLKNPPDSTIKYIAIPIEKVNQLQTSQENIIKYNIEKIQSMLPNAIKSLNVDHSAKPNNSWAYTRNAPLLTLLHFSDIHGDQVELQQLTKLKKCLISKDCFDQLRFVNVKGPLPIQHLEMICTGDLVYNSVSDDFTYWDNIPETKDILLALGNHDAYAPQQSSSDETSSSNYEAQIQSYARYFQYANGSETINRIENDWNATPGGNSCCYYYKDYSNEKIRLIVLNDVLGKVGGESTLEENNEPIATTDNSKQRLWFRNILASAKSNNYNVVVAKHFPIPNSEKITSNWTRIDKDVGTGWLQDTYVEEVRDFIDDGGKFICWICGHSHSDYILRSITDPRQLCIVIDAANREQCNQYSDVMRVDGTITQDLANLITFDTSTQTIRIIRVGCNINSYLMPRNTITINYASEWDIDENNQVTINKPAGEILAQT